VAVLANDEPAEEQPEYVARRLAAIAIGRPISEPKIVRLDPKVLDACVGQYRESADETLTVRREGDRLLGEETGNPEFEMFPVSDSTFIVKAFDARITFDRDAGGKVTGLVYSFGGHDTSLKKIR
jgi:hypothetical protein